MPVSTRLAAASLIALMILGPGHAVRAQDLRTGSAAYGDWQDNQPGVWRRLTVADLPAPTPKTRASEQPFST